MREDKIKILIEDILTKQNLENIEILFTKSAVSVVVYRSAGLNLRDLEKTTREIQRTLEATFPGDEIYVEVSTPGLDRVIRNVKEFNVFKGKELKIDIEGRDEPLFGVIDKFEDGILKVFVDKEIVEIEIEKIKKAKLFDRTFRR